MTNTEHHGVGETMVVARAAGGDADAFDTLYRRHGEPAWRLAVALTGDRDDATSVVPGGFARVFAGIKDGRIAPEADFRTQLLAAVRNAALDLARHRRDIDEAAPHAPSTHEHLLGRAFAELPERWRSALWLTVVEDVAPGAVAPVVELSPHDTAQLVGRARRGLHEQFLNAHLADTGDRNCARAIPRLSAHAADELDEGDREKLERHLSLCDGCTDRRRRLDDLAGGLAVLVPALPDEVAEPTRSAWSVAVAPTRERTATGLSATTEKLLAGVSAVAAAAGVVGAAMLGGGGTRPSTAQARPISPAAATETDGPRPLELDPGIDIPDLSGSAAPVTPGSTSSSRSSGASAGSRSVVGASAPTNGRTAAGNLGPTTTTTAPPTTDPKTAPPAPPATGAPPAPAPAPADEPVVSVGTTVGDVPVAVEVGAEPGVTVGPISVGSQPQPTASPLDLGGPLAPVGEIVDDLSDQLGVSGLLGG